MIYFVDEERLHDLKKFCCLQTIYSCRIMCLINSYGLGFDFVRFWLQYDESGNVVSAVSEFDGAATVQTTKNSDILELTEFLRIFDFTSVLSDRCFFGNKKNSCGIVMKLENPVRKTYVSKAKIEINPDLRVVYGLLKECKSENFLVPEYEAFLLDMSHKIRHDTALCVAVKKENLTVSVSMTVAQSENTAIIGAVASCPEFRGQGYGGMAVMSLAELLGKRKIFIMRGECENEMFYRSLGFKNTEKFIVSEGKN